MEGKESLLSGKVSTVHSALCHRGQNKQSTFFTGPGQIQDNQQTRGPGGGCNTSKNNNSE